MHLPYSSISSCLIDYYFTKIYSRQIINSKKTIQPMNIIGLHDMFSIYQMLQLSSSNEFDQLCQKKIDDNSEDSQVKNYNHYLERCGLVDLIDLYHQCQWKSSTDILEFNHNHIQTKLDRLFFNQLYPTLLVDHPLSDCLPEKSISRVNNLFKLLVFHLIIVILELSSTYILYIFILIIGYTK